MKEDQMRLFTSILTTVLLITATGCSNSAIHLHDDKQLIITNETAAIEVTSASVQSKRINMSSLYVDQYVLSVEKDECIVYEDIRTAAGYRFNYAYKRSIDLIFNAYNVEVLKRYGNLTLYRVTLRDEVKSIVNLLALTSSKKSLKLIYGFSDTGTQHIQDSLEQNSTVVKYELKSVLKPHERCIKTQWVPKLLIMDNLVSKEGGRLRR